MAMAMVMVTKTQRYPDNGRGEVKTIKSPRGGKAGIFREFNKVNGSGSPW